MYRSSTYGYVPSDAELRDTALQFLAVARRLLSAQEVAWAVTLGACDHEVYTVASLAELVDPAKVFGLILPCIDQATLVNDLTKKQIQLKQTVREFLLIEWDCETLEAIMLDTCIRYLLLHPIGTTPLFSQELLAIEQLPQSTDLFNDRGPFEYDRNCTCDVWEADEVHYDPPECFSKFFVYASSYWLEHYGAVGNDHLPRLQDIETLCQAGSILLDNWTKQHCRPNRALKARFDFPNHLYDPLIITALYDTEAMLLHLLDNAGVQSNKYLPSSAMNAADQMLRWGTLSKLRIIFPHHRCWQQIWRFDFFRLIIDRWSGIHIRQRHEN